MIITQKASIKRSSLNNCSADVRAFKTANLFENTCYKCRAGLQPGTSPMVSFSRIFSVHFVPSKISPPPPPPCVFFLPTNSLLLIVIDKFSNRNSCGYCLRRSRKFLRERLHWSSQESCCLPTCGLLIIPDGLTFSPDFQNTEKLSWGVLQN